MCITCIKRVDKPLFLTLRTVATVATSLAVLAQQGHAFHTLHVNIMLSTGTRTALRRASTALPLQLLPFARRRAAPAAAATAALNSCPPITVRQSYALSMLAWQDGEEPRERREVDRGFSSSRGGGGVTDRTDRSFSGGARNHRSPSEGRGGGRRGGGDWGGDSHGDRGGGGERQQRFSGERGGRGRRGGNGDRFRGGGSGRANDRYEQRGRGGRDGGGDWDQATDSRGGGWGNGRAGGRSGYNADFGDRRSGGRSSSDWDDRGGRGGPREGGRGRSFGGRGPPRGGEMGRGAGRSSRSNDGPSRAWTPELGGDDGDVVGYGGQRGEGQRRKGTDRYVDRDDAGYGDDYGEENEGDLEEQAGGRRAEGSTPASEWMRGELCENVGREVFYLSCFFCSENGMSRQGRSWVIGGSRNMYVTVMICHNVSRFTSR